MSAPELSDAEIAALTIHDLPIEGVLVGSVGSKTAVFRKLNERMVDGERTERVELVAVLDYAPVMQAEVTRKISAVIAHVARSEHIKPTRFVHERDADGRTVATIARFDPRDL